MLINSLIEIYFNAIHLPNVEDKIEKFEDIKHIEINIPKIYFGKKNYYWEIFDPYIKDEPINGSLSDDILDIYRDLQKGISLY